MKSNKFMLFFSLCTLLSLLTGLLAPVPVTPVSAQDGAGITVEPEVLAQFAEKGNATYRIIFSNQPDLSPAYKMNWTDRGWFVYDQLTAAAKESQAETIAYLDANEVKYQTFWINNSIAVDSSSKEVFDGLLTLKGIDAIRAPRTASLIEPEIIPITEAETQSLEANISHINADDVWSMGYTGTGIVVANIDTGVRYTHQALVGHYRGNLGGGTFDSNYNWWDPYGDHPTAPADDNGHGSHTMGTMIGDDGGTNQIGVAPGAKWMACRACSTSSCTDAALLGCAQFMAAPTDLAGANANPDKRPNVINNSWGDCSRSYDSWYQSSVNAWQAAGIYPVFSNGNASNCSYSAPPGLNTVGSPARYGNVTGVGSTGQSNGLYATHSNWGPTDNLDTINPDGFPEMKPQVAAPGVNIRSSVPTSDSSYEGGWSGTSMSAPHVTGMIALIWQAAPCLIGNYSATETLLEDTATHITYDDGSAATPTNYPNYATGWGEIDALAAVNQALTMCGDATINGTVTSAEGPVANATVTLTGTDPANNYTTTTNASGYYVVHLYSDTYSITASAFGYADNTASNVIVAPGATETQNFYLAPGSTVNVSGTVTDADHGYPLYAKIDVTANGTTNHYFSDPFTGTYSIDLFYGETYSFTISAVISGFTSVSEDILANSNMVIDYPLYANLTDCSAPGYTGSGSIQENFDTVTAPALPTNWATANVSGTGPWSTNAGTLNPSGGGTVSSPNVAIFKSYTYAAGVSGRLYKTTPYDLSLSTDKQLHFWMYHNTRYSASIDQVQVQLSTDNGTTWNNVGSAVSRYDGSTGWKEHTIDLSAYGSSTAVLIGFLGTSAYGDDIHIDNVFISGSCTLQSGGMVGGIVSDTTGLTLNGVTVSSNITTTIASTTTFATPDDLNTPDGLYYLFTIPGTQTITASLTGYTDTSRPVTALANALVQRNIVFGNTPPNAPSSPSPADLATSVSITTTLSWSDSDPDNDALFYDVYLETGDTSPDVQIANDITSTLTSSGVMSANTTYYWQVVATDEHGEATAGPVWSFTTSGAPSNFNKSTPAHKAIEIALNPTLTWAASTGATSYEYCIDTVSNTTCDTSWISTGATTSVALSGLSPTTTYYWQVRAKNTYGTKYANANTWWYFTTVGGPPVNFSKTTPAHRATSISTAPTLVWAASTGATSYEYCIDTVSNTTCDTSWISTGANTSVALSGLTPGTIYYWQVRAKNASGTKYANANTWWYFTTQITPPVNFYKTTPAHRSTGISTAPTLTWGASTGATSYEYCIDTSADAVCDTSWISTGADTSAALSGLTPGATYYWQVRAKNAGGTKYANANTWWYFTTSLVLIQ